MVEHHDILSWTIAIMQQKLSEKILSQTFLCFFGMPGKTIIAPSKQCCLWFLIWKNDRPRLVQSATTTVLLDIHSQFIFKISKWNSLVKISTDNLLLPKTHDLFVSLVPVFAQESEILNESKNCHWVKPPLHFHFPHNFGPQFYQQKLNWQLVAFKALFVIDTNDFVICSDFLEDPGGRKN